MNTSFVARVALALACSIAVVGSSGCDDKDKSAKTGKKDGGKKGGRKGRKGGDNSGKKKVNPATAASAAPAVGSAKPPTPPPDLPELSAQAKPEESKTTAAKAPAAGSEPKCGETSFGEGSVILECADAPAEPTPNPLTPVLSYATLHVDPALLPAVVDHREGGGEGVVRSQGKTPTGSAFALASAVDHAIAVWSGAPSHVSAMQIWARYHVPNTSSAIKANVVAGFADEETWPFVASDAVSFLDAAACEKEKWVGSVKCGKAPEADKKAAADGKLVTTTPDVVDLGAGAAAVEVAQLRTLIASDHDVMVTLKLPAAFKTVGKEGAMYVPHYDGGKGVQTVVLAGYATYAHGTYFLVHGSFGDKWGDKGYAFVHEATLKANATHAWVIDARPSDAAKLKRKPHKNPDQPCTQGQFPDSATGQCKGVCGDRSPRHANVCPKVGDCPKGQVNLWGECVLAAPVTKGEDQETKMRWVCGSGGCFYRYAKGKLGCEKDACTTSCAAPNYRLMQSKDGVACFE